jgi:hypothetical protein
MSYDAGEEAPRKVTAEEIAAGLKGRQARVTSAIQAIDFFAAHTSRDLNTGALRVTSPITAEVAAHVAPHLAIIDHPEFDPNASFRITRTEVSSFRVALGGIIEANQV